ncbi:MAG: fasciclin domain-containing protein, partial [Cyanobacteria bacterium J06636_16]
NRFVGLLSALIVLPVAVACQEQAADTTSEAPVDTEIPDDTGVTTDPETPTAAEPAPDSGATVVDVAVANGSFDTLVAAVQAAGLEGTLSAEGPYTVFAPTDEAFAALPEGVLDALLLPENQAVLAQILAYHVVSGEVPSSAVATGAVPTAAGEDLNLVADATGVTVNDATVIQPDVTASNGIIHVIDTVLIPPSVDPSAL